MKKYNTMLDVAFSVEHSCEDPYEIPIPEILRAMKDRLEYLKENPQDADGAFGVCDTYEIPDCAEVKNED